MQIFIPTRDRINAQHTWENLTDNLRSQTVLVCPASEAETHMANGRPVLVRPDGPLCKVRQWLVEEICDKNQPLIMLDDDLCFFKRKVPEAYNLEPIQNDPKLDVMFQILNDLVAVEGYAHAGLSARQGNNNLFPHEIKNTYRVNAVHCVNPRTLIKENIRYDALTLMHDYHVTLSLLEKKYDNAIISHYAWDQCGVSGAPGGFSHYRTKERMREAAFLLKDLHPDYVRVIEKEKKSGGEAMGGTRIDARIHWVSAFTGKPLSPPVWEPRRGPYLVDHSYRRDRETRTAELIALIVEKAQLSAEPAEAKVMVDNTIE